MKRNILTFLCLLLTLCLLLPAFAACGEDENTPAPDPDPQVTPDNTEGGNGGNTEGGNTEGGNTEGGNTEGGNGGNDPATVNAILKKIADATATTMAYTGSYKATMDGVYEDGESHVSQTINAETKELLRISNNAYGGEVPYSGSETRKIVKVGDEYAEYYRDIINDNDPSVSYQKKSPLEAYLYLHPEKEQHYSPFKDGLTEFAMVLTGIDGCDTIEHLEAYLAEASAEEQAMAPGTVCTDTYEVTEKDGTQVLKATHVSTMTEGTTVGTMTAVLTVTAKDGKIVSIANVSTTTMTVNGVAVGDPETDSQAVQISYAFDTALFDSVVPEIELADAYPYDFDDLTLPVVAHGVKMWINTYSMHEVKTAAECIAAIASYTGHVEFGGCTIELFSDEIRTVPLTAPDGMTADELGIYFYEHGVYADIHAPAGNAVVVYRFMIDTSALSDMYKMMIYAAGYAEEQYACSAENGATVPVAMPYYPVVDGVAYDYTLGVEHVDADHEFTASSEGDAFYTIVRTTILTDETVMPFLYG